MFQKRLFRRRQIFPIARDLAEIADVPAIMQSFFLMAEALHRGAELPYLPPDISEQRIRMRSEVA